MSKEALEMNVETGSGQSVLLGQMGHLLWVSGSVTGNQIIHLAIFENGDVIKFRDYCKL